MSDSLGPHELLHTRSFILSFLDFSIPSGCSRNALPMETPRGELPDKIFLLKGPVDQSSSLCKYCRSCVSFPVLYYLPESAKLMSIESVMPSNHLILCHLLILLPSIFPSIRVFSSELVLHIRWPKYWNFNLSISPSNEYSGLIPFRIDWFDLLAVRDSQESSPTPQLESINSLSLSLLYGPTLTSIHDYWENHSSDYMDLCG